MYKEFPQIYFEDDAPQDLQQLIQMNRVERMHINKAESDKENTGPFYVWLTMHSGDDIAVHKGTLDSCKEEYRKISEDLDKYVDNVFEKQIATRKAHT